MFEDFGEQESFFDYLDECCTWPDTERLDWAWARLRVNDLRQAVYTIEDQKTRPPRRRIESYEAELLVELDSTLSLCWYPSELQKELQKIKDLMHKAMFLGSELKAGTLKLSAAKGEKFTGGRRGRSRLYALVESLLKQHGPDTSARRVWSLLKSECGGPIIDEIVEDDEWLIFLRGKDETVSYRALEKRLSDIRKAVRK